MIFKIKGWARLFNTGNHGFKKFCPSFNLKNHGFKKFCPSFNLKNHSFKKILSHPLILKIMVLKKPFILNSKKSWFPRFIVNTFIL